MYASVIMIDASRIAGIMISGSDRSIPCLLRGVNDSNEIVRVAAITALWHIHPDPHWSCQH